MTAAYHVSTPKQRGLTHLVRPDPFGSSGIVSVDCAKRRSKWMFCDFYGRVLVEPTAVEHTLGGLTAMSELITAAKQAHGIKDLIVAVEMTGIFHRPVQHACRKAGFETRLVHPFASKHFNKPLHPDDKTGDHDLEAIFHAAATVGSYANPCFRIGSNTLSGAV